MILSLRPSAPRQWLSRVALLLGLLCLCPYLPAQNSKKVKQMQAERTALKKKIDEGEQLLRANRRDVKSQMNNLAILDAQINDHQRLMNGIKTEADSLQGNIVQLNNDIALLQTQLEKCKANYRRALTYVSQSLAKQSRWQYVLMAKDFRAMYRRIRYMVEFSKNQKAHGTLIAQKEKQLRQKQQALHQAKSEKDSLLVEGRQTRATLDTKKKEREAVVNDLNQQQKQLQQNIAKQRKEYTALNQRIDKLIQQEIAAAEARRREEARKREEAKKREEARRREAQRKAEAEARKAAKAKAANSQGKNKKGQAVAAAKNKTSNKAAASKESAPVFSNFTETDARLSNNFAANRGRLPAPITGSFSVTSRFGQYNVQGLSGVTLDNKGVNLTGRSGAQARSIFNGEVSAVVNLGGAFTVIVRHGDYYSVYSNLANVGVHRGQQVSTSQALGTVAGDGNGNAMLHFQLRHNTQKLNPLSWFAH